MEAKRLIGLPALLIAIFLLVPSLATAGDDAETKGKVWVGGHTSFVGDEGTIVKAGEYYLGREIYQSDLWLDFFGKSGDNRIETQLLYLDERDFGFWMRADAGRYISARTHYRSFHHWLDHDLLEGMAYQEKVGVKDDGSDKGGGKILTSEDLDPTGQYGIRVSEMRQRIDVTFPGNEAVTPSLRAEYREMRRFGHDQKMSVDHCSNCHVRSRPELVNERTQDLRGSLSAAFSKFRVWYDFLGRRFVNQSDPSSNYYMKARHPVKTGDDPNSSDPADFNLTEFGSRVQYHDETLALNNAPDMEKQTHALRIRAELPASNTVTAAGSYSKTENLREKLEVTGQAYALGWYKPVGQNLRLTASGAMRTIDADEVFVDLDPWRDGRTGGGQDFDWTRRSAYVRDEITAKASAVYRIRPRCSAGLHYRFRSIDRKNIILDEDDPEQTQTLQHRVHASVNSRAVKSVRVSAKVEYEMTDFPFVQIGLCEGDIPDSLDTEVGTVFYFTREALKEGAGGNLPTAAIRGNANISYRVNPKFSVSGYVSIASEKNDELGSYEWERTAYQPGAMAYLIPSSKAAISGGVSFSMIESNAKACIPLMDG